MVFSQTCLNTQRLLKLIEIDRLKSEKNQQVNFRNGGTTDGRTQSALSPAPTTSFSEVRGIATAVSTTIPLPTIVNIIDVTFVIFSAPSQGTF